MPTIPSMKLLLEVFSSVSIKIVPSKEIEIIIEIIAKVNGIPNLVIVSNCTFSVKNIA